jgi:hypothetical protein
VRRFLGGFLILLADGKFRCFLLVASCSAESLQGQWIPPAALRQVPVLADCHMTRRGVGVSLQPTLFYPRGAIFLCPERQREIDARRPGASRFFLIHEYGHLAMRAREEAVADEWAARQLASVPGERGTLKAVIFYFVDTGTVFDPLYGTGFDRALRIARAANIAEREWPGQLLAYARAQDDQRKNGTSLTLRTMAGYANAAQMIIWIDGRPVGVLSNVSGEKLLEMPKLVPGRHLLQAEQVWLYHTEPSGVKAEVARRLQAECEFESTGKKGIAIEIHYDDSDRDTLSIRAMEVW